MRLASLFGNWKYISIFVLGVGVGIFGAPLWKVALIQLNENTYGELVFKCDGAMKSHLIAKHRLELYPSDQNVTELKSAEVALLDCQTYDFKRKQLIRWGLDENDLADMGLRAIEANGKSLEQVIKIHEFQY